MQTINFLALRGNYVHHHSSSLHPFVTSYPLLRRHSYVSLRSYSTVRASAFTPNSGSQGEPMDDNNEYMKKALKWVIMSPLDEKYPEELKELLPIFSKYNLFRYRTIIQVERLLKLPDISEAEDGPKFSKDARTFLINIIYKFRESNMHMYEILKNKNYSESNMHMYEILKNKNYVKEQDVKSVVNFLKEESKYKSDEISQFLEYYPFTCTPEVIKLAYGMMLEEARNLVMYPAMRGIWMALFEMEKDKAHVLMRSHTRDQPTQPPTPTLGKELELVAIKLNKCATEIVNLGQFRSGGENYYGDDINFKDRINKLFWEIIKFNELLVEFNKEIRSYISCGYFKLKEGDPIEFERNTTDLLSFPKIFETLNPMNKPFSKMHMDVVEGVGCFFVWYKDMLPEDLGKVLGYSLVGYKGMLRMLKKIE